MAIGENRTMPPWLRRVVASAWLGVVSVTSAFGNVSTAFAATGGNDDGAAEQATVTLTDIEHGTLSFSTTDEKSLTVDVGSEVEVDVAADDGYSIANLFISTVDELTADDAADGEVSEARTSVSDAVAVSDGRATVTVTADMAVSAMAIESVAGSGDLVSAATDTEVTASDVDGGVDEASWESLAGDLDDSIVSAETDDPAVVDSIVMSYQVYDASVVGADATADSIASDNDAIASGLLSIQQSASAVYDFGDGTDYYVVRVAEAPSAAKLVGETLSANDITGHTSDDYRYDEAKGVLYIKKSVLDEFRQYRYDWFGETYGDEFDAESADDLRNVTKFQLTYVRDGVGERSTGFDVYVSNDGVSADVLSGNVSASAAASTTDIKLTDADGALSADMIDAVVVNGLSYTVGTDASDSHVAYDAASGTLSIASGALALSSVDIRVSDNFGKGVLRFFGNVASAVSSVLVTPAYAHTSDDAGHWSYGSEGTISQNPSGLQTEFLINGTAYYASKGMTEAGFDENAALVGGSGAWGETVAASDCWYGTWSFDEMRAWTEGRDNGTFFGVRWSEQTLTAQGVTIKVPASNMRLSCTHSSAEACYYINGHELAWGDSEDGRWSNDIAVGIRDAKACGTGYDILFMVMTAFCPTGSQQGAGFFVLHCEPDSVPVKLHKQLVDSDDCGNATAIAAANDAYSMAGAQYQLFTDAACTSPVEAAEGGPVVFTIGDGNVDAWSNSIRVRPGNYFLKEIKEPDCGLYKLDQTVRPVQVSAANGTNEITINAPETLDVDPFSVSFGKNLGSAAPGKMGAWGYTESKGANWTAYGDFTLENAKGISFTAVYLPMSGETTTYEQVRQRIKDISGVDIKTLGDMSSADRIAAVNKITSAIDAMGSGQGGYMYVTDLTPDERFGVLSFADAHQGDANTSHWFTFEDGDVSVVDGMVIMLETSKTDTSAFQSQARTSTFAFYQTGMNEWSETSQRLVDESGDPDAEKTGAGLVLKYPAETGEENRYEINALYDKPKVAQLNIVKYDADTGTTGGNVHGDADLAGVELAVKNISADKVQVKASSTGTGWSFGDDRTSVTVANEAEYYEYAVGSVVGYITMTNSKDAKGNAVTIGQTAQLPIGTYEVYESSGNESYNANASWKWTLKVVAPGDDNLGGKDYNVDDDDRVVYVKAHSDNNVENVETPTLNTTVAHSHTYYVCNTCSKQFEDVSEFEKHLSSTKHDGYNKVDGAYVCNDGDFKTSNLAEMRTHLAKTGHTCYAVKTVAGCTANHNENGSTDNSALFDDVKRYGALVVKTDSETGLSAAQGDAELANTCYEVYNESKQSVTVNGVKYARGQKIMTIATEWDADFVYQGKKGAYVASTNSYIQENGKTRCDDGDGHDVSGDSHAHCAGTLPYGTYRIKEVQASVGYNKGDASGKNVFEATFSTTGRADGWMQVYAQGDATDGAGLTSVNTVMHGSATVVKADYDTKTSVAQGDATLAGVTYGVFNLSQAALHNANDGDVWSHQFQRLADQTTLEALKAYVAGVENGTADMDEAIAKLKADKSLVATATTAYNEETGRYEATFDNLAYGTYVIVELGSSEGYHNTTPDGIWFSDTFSIRADGEKHLFDAPAGRTSAPTGYTYHHAWNEDMVIRGDVVIAKVDRETGQYKALGESTFEDATFEIVNKSAAAVIYQGKSYEPGEVVTTISTSYDERSGKTIATTCENLSYDAATDTYSCSCEWDCQQALPYGTYDIYETGADSSVKFDTASKKYVRTFTIREQNQVADLTGDYDSADFASNQAVAGDPVANAPIREDFHFIKKDEDSMERMANVAWKITSKTTGESHVIVTDENGEWGSAHGDHNVKTNANDPTSPVSNGAVAIDADGNWYVADSSKLDCDAGTWFTGLADKYVAWAADGKSYTVSNDRGQGTSTVVVPEDSTCTGGRVFPYDTYTLEELRCDANEGYKLITVTVTLHRDSKDPDDNGIDVDYGTLDNKKVVYDVSTKLTDADGNKMVSEGSSVTLTDTVSWSGNGFAAGEKFTVKGELHVKNDDGSAGDVVARAQATIKGNGIGGTTEVTYSGVDTSALGGRELVCFEYVYDAKGNEVARHEDASDADQTVSVPHIGTTATGDIESESSAANQTVTIADEVAYSGLKAGKTYVIEGALHVKGADGTDAGVLLDADGDEVTAKTRFVATSASGTATVTFRFKNPGTLEGATVVAFEELYKGDTALAVHADIADEGQSVDFPKIRTKAVNADDGTKMLDAAEKQVVTDTVSYSNLKVGLEYKVFGTLHVKDADGNDAGVLTDADGNEVTAEKTFTPEKASGTVELEFDLDASLLAGKTLVAFETVTRAGVEVAVHADIADEDQTVHVPSLGTTLTAEGDVLAKRPDDLLGEGITLVDTVAYDNVVKGREYTVAGELHVKNVDKDGNVTDGGVLKDADGNEVTAKAVFTAKETSGTAEVKFAFTAPAGFGEKDVVAFETLTCKGETDSTKDSDVEKAKHADIADEGQTVHFVDLQTTATDKANGTHQATCSTTVTIEDVVSTTNLKVGEEYTVKGTLHVQSVDEAGNVTDGGVVTDADGNEVTAETTVTATKPSGDIVVTFKFTVDEGAYDGKTFVAFEELYHDGKMFASHADIADEAQSVQVSKLGTTLTGEDKQSKTVAAGETTKLVDTVAYENLLPGQKYALKGYLVDATGKQVSDTVSTEFTPEKSDGTVEMEFTVDTSAMGDNSRLVAFEYLYITVDGTEHKVGQHEDLEDEGQTVIVSNPPADDDVPTPSDDTPTPVDESQSTPKDKATLQTGIDSLAAPVAILALVAAGAVAFCAYRRRRASDEASDEQ